MPRWLSNALLFVASFAVALYLHLGFGGSNLDLTQAEAIDQTAKGPVARIESFRLVGVKSRVLLEDSDQIEALWQRFNDATALHASLDWSQLQTAFAYYDQFDANGSSAVLIIGYPETSLNRAINLPRHEVEPGSYLHWDLPDNKLEGVTQTWGELLSKIEKPRAVIERYGMDAWGQTTHIQIQALE